MLAKFKNSIADYLDEIIYGANDGIITTFAVISAGAGASLGTEAIIIVGVANLVADGFSMGASSFLAIKTEQDVWRSRHFLSFFRRKESHTFMRSFATFGAFVVAGTMPLLPFLSPIVQGNEFLVSSVAAGVAFFLVGGIRTIVTRKGFFLSGFEMLAVGGIAASIAYTTGAFIESIIA